ncbi:dolichol-phosphate mannosyltransferase subunit 3 [Gilbertella persicaria]|uniref:dolichol-phosphate mannosyltransferase subunit 3 n=1 Tax=Gilbertella persicaria TaxID=101096 RepID=UPI00221FE4D5|nr:dolichol-phosphate mannosyltransferase subunit 3 [Gilbertella persicaria]KAI8083332.1 dolichol-phosphate mannosyltransferase subunit 3 [Gilbertella persicaria]
MTRATEAYTLGAIVLASYIVLYLGILPLPEVVQDKIVPVLPWWALITFGCYCLGTIGFALFTFRDCPEAYHELMGEIKQAKMDLRAKGLTLNE